MVSGQRKISTDKSSYGMVSTASGKATEAGVAILEAGGNAVDAAVAAALCLGVSEPQASGIGGQSMGLVYLREEDRVFAVDGSSRAPFHIQPTRLGSRPMKLGLKSSTVPSTPSMLGVLHERYGRLPLKEVMLPAIRTALDGFRLSSLQSRLLKDHADALRGDSLIETRYFREGHPAEAGTIIRQPELADTLETMAHSGWQAFYTGDIGRQITRDMQSRGGLITEMDLAQIPMPIERDPLGGSYRGLRVYTFPPPGAGRVLIQLLNILEEFPPELLNPEEPAGALIYALAFRFALNDRKKMPVHPDYYSEAANQMMTEKGYGQELAKRIERIGTYVMGEGFTAPPTSGETTHLSVMDRQGNAVGITQSVELVFGSKAMADQLGFFYNNYMSAFEYEDMTHPYFLLPGGKPWSSVAPTLLFQNGDPLLLLGSPGSERISTSLAQVITRVVDHHLSLEEAIAAPRFHASGNGTLLIELKRFSSDVIDVLEQSRFVVKKRGAYSFYLGCVQGVQAPAPGETQYIGVADPRRDGRAKGPKTIMKEEGGEQ